MSPTHQDLSNDTTFSQIKSRVPVPLTFQHRILFICFQHLRINFSPKGQNLNFLLQHFLGSMPSKFWQGKGVKNGPVRAFAHDGQSWNVHEFLWRKIVLLQYSFPP